MPVHPYVAGGGNVVAASVVDLGQDDGADGVQSRLVCPVNINNLNDYNTSYAYE